MQGWGGLGGAGQKGVRKVRGLAFHAPHLGPWSCSPNLGWWPRLAGNHRPAEPGQWPNAIWMLVLPGERTMVTSTPGRGHFSLQSQPASAHCLHPPRPKDCELTNRTFWENSETILSKRCLL